MTRKQVTKDDLICYILAYFGTKYDPYGCKYYS